MWGNVLASSHVLVMQAQHNERTDASVTSRVLKRGMVFNLCKLPGIPFKLWLKYEPI